MNPSPPTHAPTRPLGSRARLLSAPRLRAVLTCAVWVVVLGISSGCTAAKVNIALIQAQEDLHNAREYGAETRAPYEFTRAERYLQKAAEEYRNADYKIADALCRASSEWADQAIIVIQQRGRVDIGLVDLANEETAQPTETESGEAAAADTPPPPEEPDEFDEFKELEPEDEDETFDWEEE